MSDFKPDYELQNVITPQNTNAEALAQMREHVNSYSSLSRHNHNCLELCRRLEKLQGQVDRYKTALEKLARLGNGEHYGNSDGNVIAQQALQEQKT